MTPRVKTEDLIDAEEVAEILGLSHRNSVYTYLRRYSDMPRPVVDLGRNRVQLWLRPDVVGWAKRRNTRPGRPPQRARGGR
jgi:predicted DNA-binding transcriptional regulator AlpA